MRKKQTRRKQHVGGGQFTMYCPLCNLPFNDPHNKKNRDWLKNGLGFDEKTKSVMEVGPDDEYDGTFTIKEGDGKFCGEKYIEANRPGCDARGVVCHSDCITYIEKTMKNHFNKNNSYKFTYEEFNKMWKKTEAYRAALPAANTYMGQNYKWNNAERNNGSAFFDSPLTDGEKNSKKKIDGYIREWLSPEGGARLKTQRKTRRTRY